MINRLLNSKTKTVSLAALVLGVSAFFSYVLGALRDNFLANLLPNRLADVYWAAFRVPDFIYGLLITGGITAAFLPVFATHFKDSKESAQRLFKDVFAVFLLFLIFLSVIFFFLAPYLVHWTVPGFTAEQKEQTVYLMRIMFLSPVILGASAIFSGALQYLDLFYAFAFSPIVYNIGILFGILVLYPLLGLPGLAWGVVLGALMHLVVQAFPALRAGFSPGLSLRLKEKEGLWKIFKLMLPRTVSSAAYNINLIVITAIASTLTAGSIKVFNLSNNLYCVPVGLVGVSFASAVFPALSRSFASERKDAFLGIFSRNLKNIVFFILPLSGFLFVLRAQVVRLIYGTQFVTNGYFGWWETRLTASSLGVLAVSLFAASLIPLLSRAFFALHDTKQPVKIAVFSIILNIVMAFLFVALLKNPGHFHNSLGVLAVSLFAASLIPLLSRAFFALHDTKQPVKIAVCSIILNIVTAFLFVALLKNPGHFHNWLAGFLKLNDLPNISVLGLALALSLSTIVQFLWLLMKLRAKLKDLQLIRLKGFLIQTIFATSLATGTVYLTLHLADLFISTYKVTGLLFQTIAAILAGALVYFLTSWLMGMREPRIIWQHLISFLKTRGQASK